MFSVGCLPATYRKAYASVASLPAASLAGLFEQPEFVKNVIPFAMIAGVDGCKGGWVAAVDVGAGQTMPRFYPSFEGLIADKTISLVVIDIPIGLLSRGPRQCDLQVRRMLPRFRKSSVFPAPIRPMLKAKSWLKANRIRRSIEGKGWSQQAFGILEKICEVDLVMTRELQQRVREGHPEAAFLAMNESNPVVTRKGTKQGRLERVRLLSRFFPDAQERIEAFDRPRLVTDLIDAYACLWVARRIDRGEATSVPADPERDEKGLRAEIVY